VSSSVSKTSSSRSRYRPPDRNPTIEANSRVNGTVDMEPHEVRRLEVVVAAPHSALRTDADQTARLLGAVSTGPELQGAAEYNLLCGLFRALRRGTHLQIEGGHARSLWSLRGSPLEERGGPGVFEPVNGFRPRSQGPSIEWFVTCSALTRADQPRENHRHICGRGSVMIPRGWRGVLRRQATHGQIEQA
jgi:hypothetical protein